MQRKYVPDEHRQKKKQKTRALPLGRGRFTSGQSGASQSTSPRQQPQDSRQHQRQQNKLARAVRQGHVGASGAKLQMFHHSQQQSQQQQQPQHSQTQGRGVAVAAAAAAGIARHHPLLQQHHPSGSSYGHPTAVGGSGEVVGWTPQSTAAAQNAAVLRQRQQHALRFVPKPVPGAGTTAAATASPWAPPGAAVAPGYPSGVGKGRGGAPPPVSGKMLRHPPIRANVPLKLPPKAKGKASTTTKKSTSKSASAKVAKAGSTSAKYSTPTKASSATTKVPASLGSSKKGKKRGPKPGWKKRKAVAEAAKQGSKNLPALPISRVNRSFMVPLESVHTQTSKAIQFVGNELRHNDIWPLKQSGLQLAAVLEQCVREVLLPQLLLGKAHRDRCFWAALLGMRELMTQNATKFFELSSKDLSTAEQEVEGQMLATGIVFAALLQCPGYGNAQEKFTQLMQEYDAGKGTFATTEETMRRRTAVMGRVDGRNQPILPNGKELDAEESVAWRVSFNLARKRHPLLKGSNCVVDGDELIDLPKPTACHVSLVEELPPGLK